MEASVKIKTYERDLHKNLCNYCGSSTDTYFDEKHNDTICIECINKERIEKYENENDEDKANYRIKVHNENI